MDTLSVANKTPSVNQVYGTFIIPAKPGRKPRIMSGMHTEFKKVKREIQNKLFLMDTKKFEKYKDKKLFVTLGVHGNWHNKDGSVKKKDIANYEKFITDTVFEYLNMKDQFIFRYLLEKVQDDIDGFVMQIGFLEE